MTNIDLLQVHFDGREKEPDISSKDAWAVTR